MRLAQRRVARTGYAILTAMTALAVGALTTGNSASAAPTNSHAYRHGVIPSRGARAVSWNGTGGTGGAQNITFSTGSFAMQGTWSNLDKSCRVAHTIVTG